MFSHYSPLKHMLTSGFLIIKGDIKTEHRLKMGYFFIWCLAATTANFGQLWYLPIPITMPYRKFQSLRRNFEYLQFVNSPWYMLKQVTPQKGTERSKQPKATRNHPKPPKTSQKSFSKHYQSRVICETQISIKI